MPPTKRQVHSPHGDHRDGLRFLKLDLHVHSPASRCFGDKSVKADEIVKTALDRGLSGIAITDHNSGDWINQVTKASEGTDLVVFPAVEITCMGGKQGIHIVGIFDPSCTARDVEGLLAELGLKPAEYGNTDALAQKDPITVVQIVRRRGVWRS